MPRPQNLTGYIGQDRIKPIVEAEIQTFKRTGRVFRHTVLYGPPGLGKTTLGGIIANETGSTFHPITAGPDWMPDRVLDFLLKLPTDGYNNKGQREKGGDTHIVFVDEAHEMPIWETWYKALEDCEVDVEGGVSWLPDFTAILATTDLYKLPKPLVDRMGLQLLLEPYSVEQLTNLIGLQFKELDKETTKEIARRARGTARIGLNFAQSVVNFGGLSFFDQMGIDAEGLTRLDREYIDVLRSSEKPMSLANAAARLGIDSKTLAQTVEPYLLKTGKIDITGRGRVAAMGTGGRGPKSDMAEEFMKLIGGK